MADAGVGVDERDRKRMMVWHLLGDADLGLRPGMTGERAERMSQLAHAAPADRAGLIDGWVAGRSEDHHVFSPLAAALEAARLVDRRSQSDRVAGVELRLLATRQEPAHRGDTFDLAAILAATLEAEPEAFGVRVGSVEVVTIGDMTIDDFARAVAMACAAEPSDTAMVVPLAGGPASATPGVVAALMSEGYMPAVVEVNSQDRGETPLEWSGPDIIRWMVRHRLFGLAASRLEPGDQRTALEVMQDLSTLRFSGVKERIDGINDPDLRRLLQELDVPRRGPEAKKPASATEWDRLDQVMSRALAAALLSGDQAAGPLFDAMLRARFESLETGPARPEVKRFRRALRTAGATDGQLGPENGDPKPLLEVLQATNGHAELVAVRRGVESLHPFAEPGWVSALDQARQYRHRLARLGDLRGAIDVVRLPGLEEERAVLEHLGFPAPQPLSSPRTVMLLAVGMRQTAVDDPVLAAVLDVVDRASTTLVLIHSAETSMVASLLGATAEAAGLQVVLAETAGGGPGTAGATAESVMTTLRRAIPNDTGTVRVVVGPGTKPMNVGAVLAGFSFAFEMGAAFSMTMALPTGDGGTRLADSTVVTGVASGLLEDDLRAELLIDAIEAVDVLHAVALLDGAPARWSRIGRMVRRFEQDVARPGAAAAIAGERIRFHLARKHTPLLSAMRVAVEVSERFRDEGPRGWGNGDLGSARRRLWAARVAGMKEPWLKVSLDQVGARQLLDELAAVRARGGAEIPKELNMEAPLMQLRDEILERARAFKRPVPVNGVGLEES